MLPITPSVIRIPAKMRSVKKGGVANRNGASGWSLRTYIGQRLHMHSVTPRFTTVESSCFAAIMAKRQEDMNPEEIVKLIEAEEDDGGDILEELTEEDIRDIYNDLSEEDKRRFRQFRRFHRQYFGVYGEHLPSYHMARQVVRDLMPGIPSAAADTIVAKQAEILAEDRLRVLCCLHGFKFPEKEMRVEAPQEEEDEPSYRFPSVQDEYQMGIATAT